MEEWRNGRGGWTKAHSRFIRLVLKKVEKKDTQVIYLRGNPPAKASSVFRLTLAQHLGA